jgi:hypothetical protein
MVMDDDVSAVTVEELSTRVVDEVEALVGRQGVALAPKARKATVAAAKIERRAISNRARERSQGIPSG